MSGGGGGGGGSGGGASAKGGKAGHTSAKGGKTGDTNDAIDREDDDNNDNANGSDDDELNTSSSSDSHLRANVSSKSSQAWKFRGERDVYTNFRNYTDIVKPEVDHVWEIQLLDRAWEKATQHIPPSVLHAGREAVAKFVNDVGNLNVTSHIVNQKKKGPFMRWKKRLDESRLRQRPLIEAIELSARADESREMRKMIDNGTWSRICGTIVTTFDYLHEECNSGKAPATAQRIVVEFGDQVHELLTAMKID